MTAFEAQNRSNPVTREPFEEVRREVREREKKKTNHS